VEVAGLALSRPGLWSAWSIVAKGLIGASVLVVLAATTSATDLLRGLARLRVPAVLVAIASFMLRFGVLVRDQARSMARARVARGHRPRTLADIGPVAASVGALFVRAHERGERVHAAMVSRGYTGTFPEVATVTAPRGDWMVLAVVVTAATALALVARTGLG
jgi:cobalt/nickel transport system permease protein